MGASGISLVDIGQGAAVEKFDHELQQALDNIQDPNTPARKARKVVLTVTITPDEEREMGKVRIEAKCVLPAPEPSDIKWFLGRKPDGKGEASEYNPRQHRMDFDGDQPEAPEGASDKVRPIKGQEARG